MAKYKQTYIYDNEDSFGQNEVQFIIADAMNLLFDVTTAVDVDIFSFQKLKIAFQGDGGGLVQDELDLLSADHLVKNSDEQACLDLVNSSISTKVYCAVILNANDPLEKEDVLYVGVFDEDIKEEATKWDRTEYANTATISLTYKYNLIPIIEANFDEIKMSEVLEAIDSTWITANVEDKQAWRTMSDTPTWEYPNGERGGQYDLEAYCCDLVSLNKLLRKIGDEAMSVFNTTHSTSYSLNFTNRVKLVGKYTPARWRVPRTDQPWLANKSKEKADYSRNSEKWSDLEMYHNLDDATDYRQYYIDPDEIETFSEDDSLWVDFKYFFDLENDNEYSSTTAKTYRIGGDDITFTDFLYKFAANFGFLLLLEIDVVAEEINITFASSDYIEEAEVLYFKDAEKYKRDLSTKSNESDTPFQSESFYGVGDSTFGKTAENNGGIIYGKDMGGVVNPGSTINESADRLDALEEKENTGGKGEKLLFSISPTVARLKMPANTSITMDTIGGRRVAPIEVRNGHIIPHNIKIDIDIDYTVGTDDAHHPINIWTFYTRSIHTALYIKIAQKESHEPTNYFTPIRAMSVKIDNEEMLFDTLESFLNVSRLRYYKFSKQDIEMSIPYWNAFSTSSDGSNASLKNLKLGKKITLNSIAYIIHSIDIDFEKPQVNLKLKQETLISEIKNPSSPKTTDSLLGVEGAIIGIEDYSKFYIEGTSAPFSALAYNDGGALETILAVSQVDNYFGLSLETVEDDYAQVIQSPGIYNIDTSDYDVDDILYLRIDGTTGNTSITALTQYESATDKIYKRIGKIISENVILLFDEPYYEFAQ